MLFKKKLLAIILCASLSLSVVACSNNSTGKEKQGTVKQVENNKDVETEDFEGLEKTTMFTNENLNVVGESGSLKYKFKAIHISNLKVKTKDVGDILGVDIDDELTLVSFNTEFENVSDNNITTMTDTATITTNTKEQSELDLILTDDQVGGDFNGKVKKEGQMNFFLKKTKSEDLKNIKLNILAPWDTDSGAEIGKNISLEFKTE